MKTKTLLLVVATAGLMAPVSGKDNQTNGTTGPRGKSLQITGVTHYAPNRSDVIHGSSITHHVYQDVSDADVKKIIEQIEKRQRPTFVAPQGDKHPNWGWLRLMCGMTN